MKDARRRSAGNRLALSVLVLGMAFTSGCGGKADGGGTERARNTTRFAREDGSVARFPSLVRAWCGPFDEDNADIEAIHLLAGALPNGEGLADPFWIVSGVRADVERDRETVFPNDFVYTEPRGASFFALDDAKHQHNELSSASERSAGLIRIQLSGCERGDEVEVTFDDVTLGSEFGDGPSVSVDGIVVTQVGDPP